MNGHLGNKVIEKYYKNHNELDNLDYEHSGHTGFQKAGNYVLKEELNNYVTKEELNNYGICRIPFIEARSLNNENNENNIIRLFFRGITPEFKELVNKKEGIQIHLLKYAKVQRRCFYNKIDEKIKLNEKKWTHPSNILLFNKNAVSKQCWGIRSLLIQILNEGYSEEEFNEYLQNSEYPIYNNGIVPSEFNVTNDLINKGYMDLNLNEIMSCILVNIGEKYNLDFLIKENSTRFIKIIGCKYSKRNLKMSQPIKFQFALPFIENGHKKFIYGNSNTIILQCAKIRINGEECGYGANKINRIIPNIGYGVKIK